MKSCDEFVRHFDVWFSYLAKHESLDIEERLIFDYKLSIHPVLWEVFVKHKVIYTNLDSSLISRGDRSIFHFCIPSLLMVLLYLPSYHSQQSNCSMKLNNYDSGLLQCFCFIELYLFNYVTKWGFLDSTNFELKCCYFWLLKNSIFTFTFISKIIIFYFESLLLGH